MEKECYFKIGDHIYYRMKTGECIAVNTERKAVKKLVSIPSAYMKDVTIIAKDEFEQAINSILSDL